MNNSDIENLEKFINENPDLEKLEDIMDEFNIFTALNIIDQELKHSDFLSWLMNPNESHGLDDYFLKLFLEKVAVKASKLEIKTPSIFEIDSWGFDDAEVLREWRNIDILIKSEKQKFFCLIENKIRSPEGIDQLKRYKNIADNEFKGFKNRFYVFLTVEGDKPSEEMQGYYINFDYREIILLINQLIKSKGNKIGTEILTLISNYKYMLERYVMEDSDIQKICKQIYQKHRKALELIIKYVGDTRQEIYSYLTDLIKNNSELILDDSTKSYIRFIPKNLDFIPKNGDGWTGTKRILLFEFYNAEKKLDLNLLIGPGQEIIREKLFNIAKSNPDIFSVVGKRKLAKLHSQIFKKKILKLKDYDENEFENIKLIIEQKFKKLLSEDVPKIENELKKFN